MKIHLFENMKHAFYLAGLLLSATIATTQAATISETHSMSVTTTIPDGDLNGVVQSMNPSTLISSVEFVTLTLTTTGGWNGDLYAYLSHDGAISILTNRAGRTASVPSGTATGGMTVTFDDAAAGDIHSAPGGFGTAIVGTFQPSGRNINPLLAFDTTTRAAPLSTFAGHPAAGEWRLYVVDAASGDQATLQSWSLNLTGTLIPEPTTGLLSGMVMLGLLARRRRG
jgi:hypothetical protein